MPNHVILFVYNAAKYSPDDVTEGKARCFPLGSSISDDDPMFENLKAVAVQACRCLGLNEDNLGFGHIDSSAANFLQ